MKKSPYIHTEKDGATAFGLYILLPMAILFAFISKPTPAFDNQNAPVDQFQLKNKTVSFQVKPLANKVFEIPAPTGITRDSKLFVAYEVENDRLSDVKSVSYNGNIVWTK